MKCGGEGAFKLRHFLAGESIQCLNLRAERSKINGVWFRLPSNSMEISKRWSVNTERIARESVASRTMRKCPKNKRGRYLLNFSVEKYQNFEKFLILLTTIGSSVFWDTLYCTQHVPRQLCTQHVTGLGLSYQNGWGQIYAISGRNRYTLRVRYEQGRVRVWLGQG